MRGDFVGDLVAFENVLERPNADVIAFAKSQQHQDFILSITMTMNDSIAVEDLHDGVEFEIRAGW